MLQRSGEKALSTWSRSAGSRSGRELMSSVQPVPPESRQRPRGKSSSGAQKPICSEVKAKLASWRSRAGPLNPKRKEETRWSTGSTEAEEIRTLQGLKPSAPASITQVRHSMPKTLSSLNSFPLGAG